jgi:hypothetical protein
MADLVSIIASSTAARAGAIDAVLCRLIKRGAELGELDRDAAIGPDGEWREIKLPPRVWLDRICRAVEVGAFDRLDVDEIVDRILLPLPGG